MSKKTTKRALAMSFVSVFLCVCMLVGTTFAWFTDSATSSNNKIQAGTLDLDLYMWDGSDYAEITDSTDPIFGTGSIAQNNNAQTLWEPGKTQVAYLKLVNNGNLALEYTVDLNVQNVSKDLYEVMQYAITPDVKDGTGASAWLNGNSVVLGAQTVSGTTPVTMNPGATHYFALSIHMDEMAGNKYQGGEVNFDLTVLANQAPVEPDSFGPNYDANANVYDVTPATAQAALDAAEDGAVINFAAGDYGTLYFRQSEASEVVRGVAYSPNAYIRTIKNLTINGGTGVNITGFATESGTYYNTEHSNKDVYPVLDSFIVMENVKIDGFTFDGTANAFNFYGKNAIDGLTISNCEMSSNSAHYNEYVFVHQNADQGSVNNVNGETFVVKFANVTIDKCTASAVDRLVLAYTSENLTVTNNKVSGAGMHFINLQAGSVATGLTDHTGVITITDNTYTNGAGRFFRAAYLADARLVLERNTVNNAFYGQTITEHDELDLVKVNVRTGSAFTFTNYDNQINNTAVGNDGARFVPTVE